MLSYLKGIVTELNESAVTVEVGGVGYDVAAASGTLTKLSAGEPVKLYVHMAVREDDISLYGFLAKNEKNMFLRLISVSGIGCKVALAIMSGLSVQALAHAVSTSDLTVLSSVKGIGKKTAERIVLELKDKLTEEFGGGAVQSGGTGAAVSGAAGEAVLALVSLGYTKADAAAAVARIANPEKLSAEQITLLALKN